MHKAFSLYAIVDVFRRRHKMFFGIARETIRASNFKNLTHHSLASLYIFTGKDVTIYFRSAANRINMFILGHVRMAISR